MYPPPETCGPTEHTGVSRQAAAPNAILSALTARSRGVKRVAYKPDLRGEGEALIYLANSGFYSKCDGCPPAYGEMRGPWLTFLIKSHDLP